MSPDDPGVMDDFILPCSSPRVTLQLSGGKGLNLAELWRAGFPVPPAFIVTTRAYWRFVEANELQPRILALAGAIDPEDPSSLEAASAEIRALFENGQMPPPVAEAIGTALQELGSGARQQAPGTPGPHTASMGGHTGPPLRIPEPQPPSPDSQSVAVRSSATAEDLPGLSFAGQQESYLNVIGAEAVLEAVKRCWGSLWTARAIGYRARNGIPSDQVALAVVVQRMILAETSGVLFTANPLTGKRGEMVIDASFGLGEAIVSGQVEPDHYVVDLQGGRIAERRLGAKGMSVVPRPEGGTERVQRVAEALRALSDDRILELARLARRVGERLGSPQDIEWAWAEGKFHLLQARPITTLYPVPGGGPPDQLRVYASLNSIQGVTDPITPLGRNVLQILVGGLPRFLGVRRPASQILPEAGGRLFIDVTDLARDPRLRAVLLAVLERADPGAKQALLRLIQEERLSAAGEAVGRPVLTPDKIVGLLPTLAPLLGRTILALWDPQAARRRIIARADRVVARVRQHALSASSLAARLGAMEEDLTLAVPHMVPVMMAAIAPSLALLARVDQWLLEWLGIGPGAALPLMRGLPGNVTTEMDLKLWGAAQAIRADPEARDHLLDRPVEDLAESLRRGLMPHTAEQALQQFLMQYGMRAVAEIDIGRPRWREDPWPILQILKGYLRLEDPALAPDLLFRQAAAGAERLASEYVAAARRTRFGVLRARLLRWAIHRMRALGGLRESPKLYLVRLLDLYRTALLESGREMVAQGRLERAEDLFFVPLDLLRGFARGDGVDLRAVVAEQHAQYERERGRRQLPHLLLSTGEAFYEGLAGGGPGDLVGQPVSPGVAEGQVRVVLDPRGARLEPGEILVCPATDPGWTPLFLTAGGLVTEMGGLVTHGSVVAREYGIPAVVGVHEATARLRTGQRVRVDGNLGRVTVVEVTASEVPQDISGLSAA